MEVTITSAGENDKKNAATLFDIYMSEMSEITGETLHPDRKPFLYEKLFHLYWDKEDHFPYLIFCDDTLAGFSFVRRYPPDQNLYDMGQFFILNDFKGKGVGRKAFQLTLARFPGNWLTRVIVENKAAFQFWEKVIAAATQGNYLFSKERDEDLHMIFIRYTI